VIERIKNDVRVKLTALEREHGVRVLYACESGSRAWGFESTDSDFDVRFFYVHKRDWYLSIDVDLQRDVIEDATEPPLDMSGWDLKKALRLFRKSNPPLMEWLRSPIVYLKGDGVADQLRSLIDVYYSPPACRYHYLHMARGNHREYLRGDDVWLKKYLYVLRPLMAIRWIERNTTPPPMEFEFLVERTLTDEGLRSEIAALLARKRAGAELDYGPKLPSIGAFIESELDRHAGADPAGKLPRPPVGPLNALFLQTLEDVWSDRS